MSWLDSLILSGAQGPTGGNAYSLTSSSFTVPASGSNVTVSVVTGAWMVAGQVVFVAGAGYYTVVSSTATSCILTNLGTAANAAPSTNIASGAGITPAGAPGVLNGPLASDANTIGLWQVSEGASATTWANQATGTGSITATLRQQLANGSSSPGFQPGYASLFRQSSYPSYLNLGQEAGLRSTVSTAPSTSTSWTFETYFRPINSNSNSGNLLIFGYRLTSGTGISTVTETDWSFCFFTNGVVTGSTMIDWGYAFTITGGISIKELASTNFGSLQDQLLIPNTNNHIALVVTQSGSVTGYSVYLNGISVRGAQAVASLQTVSFTNSREIVALAGYPSMKCAIGSCSGFKMSNIARPASYFVSSFQSVM